ncbi:hypothetical protein [Alicyclobacillus acidiphilus]|jgi:hypothetical protein|nr:hypothetical protein [Alicyclobacillus acidiphilus]
MCDQTKIVFDKDVVSLFISVVSPKFEVVLLVLFVERLRKRLIDEASD